jgi:hypothetical protein
VAETCGLSLDEFDFVFLTSKDVTPEVERAFEKIKNKYKFRVIRAPFNSPWHLHHLDWAIEHADLNDWVFLQHCDTFWKINCEPWLKITRDFIRSKPDLMAIGMPRSNFFVFQKDSKPIPTLHDFAGAYNRKEIVQRGWRFSWGYIGGDLKPSPKLRDMILTQRFQRSKESIWRSKATPPSQQIILGQDWIDGSEWLTLELNAHYPKLIEYYDYMKNLIHPWSMFRRICTVEKKENVLLFDVDPTSFRDKMDIWATHSWISSLYFDLDESPNLIFPYRLFQDVAQANGRSFSKDPPHEIANILKRYVQPNKSLGLDDYYGITEARISDSTYKHRDGKFVRTWPITLL